MSAVGMVFLAADCGAHCEHLHGIDFSSQAIRLAQANCEEHPNISLAEQDIRSFQTSSSFDLIICSEVLYYLQGTELDDVVRNLHSISAPGAWLGLVGRAEAQLVPASLQKWFERIEHVEDKDWYRPYAVSLYTPRDDTTN
jgi:chemotaxis methyl-accepting protein methylase